MQHYTKTRMLLSFALLAASANLAFAQSTAPLSGFPATGSVTPVYQPYAIQSWPFMPYPQQALVYPRYGMPMPATPYYAYPQAYPQQTMTGYWPQQVQQQQLMQQQPMQQPTAAPRYPSPYNPAMPARPGPRPAPPAQPKTPTKPWGDTRHIWPDFYTDSTGDIWDKMINAPYDMGHMPGGWRFPSFSSPDPITVGDAVTNQLPPIMEEIPNFMNFAN